jgi:hypothetical protein
MTRPHQTISDPAHPGGEGIAAQPHSHSSTAIGVGGAGAWPPHLDDGVLIVHAAGTASTRLPGWTVAYAKLAQFRAQPACRYLE